jgi:hypothetical protein
LGLQGGSCTQQNPQQNAEKQDRNLHATNQTSGCKQKVAARLTYQGQTTSRHDFFHPNPPSD